MIEVPIIPFAGFVGITRLDIRAGELGALAVSGVFETPKADEAIDVGDPVYWDEANEVASFHVHDENRDPVYQSGKEQ